MVELMTGQDIINFIENKPLVNTEFGNVPLDYLPTELDNLKNMIDAGTIKSIAKDSLNTAIVEFLTDIDCKYDLLNGTEISEEKIMAMNAIQDIAVAFDKLTKVGQKNNLNINNLASELKTKLNDPYCSNLDLKECANKLIESINKKDQQLSFDFVKFEDKEIKKDLNKEYEELSIKINNKLEHIFQNINSGTFNPKNEYVLIKWIEQMQKLLYNYKVDTKSESNIEKKLDELSNKISRLETHIEGEKIGPEIKSFFNQYYKIADLKEMTPNPERPVFGKANNKDKLERHRQSMKMIENFDILIKSIHKYYSKIYINNISSYDRGKELIRKFDKESLEYYSKFHNIGYLTEEQLINGYTLYESLCKSFNEIVDENELLSLKKYDELTTDIDSFRTELYEFLKNLKLNIIYVYNKKNMYRVRDMISFLENAVTDSELNENKDHVAYYFNKFISEWNEIINSIENDEELRGPQPTPNVAELKENSDKYMKMVQTVYETKAKDPECNEIKLGDCIIATDFVGADGYSLNFEEKKYSKIGGKWTVIDGYNSFEIADMFYDDEMVDIKSTVKTASTSSGIKWATTGTGVYIDQKRAVKEAVKTLQSYAETKKEIENRNDNLDSFTSFPISINFNNDYIETLKNQKQNIENYNKIKKEKQEKIYNNKSIFHRGPASNEQFEDWIKNEANKENDNYTPIENPTVKIAEPKIKKAYFQGGSTEFTNRPLTEFKRKELTADEEEQYMHATFGDTTELPELEKTSTVSELASAFGLLAAFTALDNKINKPAVEVKKEYNKEEVKEEVLEIVELLKSR